MLASVGTTGRFATRLTAGVNDLYFDVVDVGPIPLPLSDRTAVKLCDVARPARYGLREKTLLDPRVRDTWEIGKRQLKIDARHWQRTLDPKLVLIGRDLGLPVGAKLRAELHNLLLYGPGQFFAPHQDSEKADGMIGSLVVLLPSDSKGGALVVETTSRREGPLSRLPQPDRASRVHLTLQIDPRDTRLRVALLFDQALCSCAHSFSVLIFGAHVPLRKKDLLRLNPESGS